MSASASGAEAALVERVVDVGIGAGCAAVDLLGALARLIDVASGSDRPASPLVLPALDDRATPVDPSLERALAAALEIGGDAVGPGLLGQVHEALLDGSHRRRRGAFYTPTDVADALVDAALSRLATDPARPGGHTGDDAAPTVCDPATGGGAFLLAAADALAASGIAATVVIERCLWGSDIDPMAVAVTEAALVLWARSHGTDVAAPNVVCADPLQAGMEAWPARHGRAFDAVVGNPPFLNQLGSGTARSAEDAAGLRARWGPAVYRYTDTAAVFLLAATHLVRPGGVVSMIVPVPVLVSGDAERLRRELLERTVPEHLWIARDDVFSVGVRVCAPVLRVIEDRPAAAAVMVTRSAGRRFEPLAPVPVDPVRLAAEPTWGVLLTGAFGVPVWGTADAGHGCLGDFCTATAGFRDEYYGLRPFVLEAAEAEASEGTGPWPVLVTSGLIDPARLRWGSGSSRFDGRRWVAPVIDLARLDREDPRLAAWARARLVPKVVVATQTRVLEAAVDVDGTWYPSVPTIALEPPLERLWDAAAVVLAPPTTAWAMNRHVGAALSADAIRVSAKQLLDAPLPPDGDAWARGTRHLRAAAVATDGPTWHDAMVGFGAAMTSAYAAPREVLSWWLGRLPRWR